ncbi:uncharacterized protein HKW66_Vig0117510 [Vigna angularis]|uniref:Uncharacterized protein n=1 Tax=Phaseolus angularis TaxID=3914 RepID=A0A8T0JYF9_PHAAN|nr:uncharacterized protein HKW66_Vig0117510 [Vigna angularis]
MHESRDEDRAGTFDEHDEDDWQFDVSASTFSLSSIGGGDIYTLRVDSLKELFRTYTIESTH